MNLEKAISIVESSGSHKILNLLSQELITLSDKETASTVCIIDLETTGFDRLTDEAIEIGMLKVGIDEDGNVTSLLGELSQLNEPKEPIPELITNITGITNEDVKGQAFDIEAIEEFIQGVDFMIAHNAGFDRKFAENITKAFEKCNWACSIVDADWIGEGFESSKLEYLNLKVGAFYSAHRATTDCLATLNILTLPSKNASTMMAKMLERASKLEVTIYAEYCSYENRLLLKSRGYKWDSGDDSGYKSWWTKGTVDEIAEEFDYIDEFVYKFPVKEILANIADPTLRYSDRIELSQIHKNDILKAGGRPHA